MRWEELWDISEKMDRYGAEKVGMKKIPNFLISYPTAGKKIPDRLNRD